ncbi:coiled-coil domain-containing protein 152 [Aquarana catesbeiana]|uniref:coiled-coil domain-containing protein 152 n=1 Tax=Aquarana catesbeiana TaxID=8400 RepID=UPI003CC9FA1F
MSAALAATRAVSPGGLSSEEEAVMELRSPGEQSRSEEETGPLESVRLEENRRSADGSTPVQPGPASSRICAVLLATLEHIADRFGIPLALEKTERPSTVIVFLGIVLDSVAMECRLPEDKLADLKKEIAVGQVQRVGIGCGAAGGALSRLVVGDSVGLVAGWIRKSKFAEVNGKNNLLEIQLERLNRLWKISQAKEQSSAEECAVLRNMIKGLQETMEAQCNMKDENCSLKKTINDLEEKLQSVTQDYKNKIELLTTEMRDKEGEFNVQMEKKCCEVETKLLLKEEEKSKLLSKKAMEISELTRQLQTQEKEKQSELIKQQIEFNAKLARIQNRSNKSYQETSTLSQNIYRMKLQHLQEEKTKEIENLRSTIKELERRLNGGTDSRLKRKRF